jgi:catabolite regulation protein CreA
MRLQPPVTCGGSLHHLWLQVSRFSDPKVQGVELYVSDFQLPMTERLTQG